MDLIGKVTIGAPGARAITSAGAPNTFQRVSREVQLAVKLYSEYGATYL